MTTDLIYRCEHCKQVFTYDPSSQYDDTWYCPECADAVAKALEAIPVKFEKRFITTKDYTREQIVEAQQQRCTRGTPVRRVLMPLFDLQDPGNKQHRVAERMQDPVSKEMLYYGVEWWSRTPEDVKVTKEVWWDIENNCEAKDQRDRDNL